MKTLCLFDPYTHSRLNMWSFSLSILRLDFNSTAKHYIRLGVSRNNTTGVPIMLQFESQGQGVTFEDLQVTKASARNATMPQQRQERSLQASKQACRI